MPKLNPECIRSLILNFIRGEHIFKIVILEVYNQIVLIIHLSSFPDIQLYNKNNQISLLNLLL